MNIELRRAFLRFAAYLIVSLIAVAAYADISKTGSQLEELQATL